MPRYTGIRNNDMVQHVMMESIQDVKLFRDDTDRDMYLSIISANMERYKFKIYAYSLMEDHAYLLMDMKGANLSDVMKCINVSYTSRYNKKYNRFGPLYADRFRSMVVQEENKLFSVINCIHNEAMAECDGDEALTKSSLGIYAGVCRDKSGIIDSQFAEKLLKEYRFSGDRYMEYVRHFSNDEVSKEIRFSDMKSTYISYRSNLVRNMSPEEILEFVSRYTGTKNVRLNWKNKRSFIKDRALAAMLMRGICGYKCADMCRILGRVSPGTTSKLSSLGYKLVSEDERYKGLIEDFINENRCQ